MLRNMSGEGHLSGGQSSSSPAGRGVASPGLDGQESSWIGLLSRPAMAFLQRYLPGRPRTPNRSETGSGWLSGGLKTSFVDEEREFLRQLDDMMPLTPAPHLTYLRCQHDGGAGRLEPRGGGALPWLTADSLQEMGIQTSEEMDLNLCQQTQIGYLSSSIRTFFSHVLLSSVSSQEIKPPGGGKSRTWWGSFWVGEEGSKTKAPETTSDPFGGWTLGENAGPADLKEVNNGGLQTVQNTEGSSVGDHHLSCSGAAAACSEAAPLTPDQDNGYSSLEEEHFQVCHLSAAKAPSEEQQQPEEEEEEADSAEISAAVQTEMEEETSEEAEEEKEEESAEATALTNPQCQNKAIAFIMGCPCSDDEDEGSSQSDGESSDDDDAGFDSEGSSDESDSTDVDEEEDDDEEDDEDSDVDSEAERLWSSLCQSVDPYNPRNFTAQLHTVTSSPPRTIPTSTPPSSAQSTPASSPPSFPPSALTSSSPPSGSDFWDDSTSASEVDEAESLRLLSSFSCSSDPYSPLNFQATLRTERPVEEAGSRTRTAGAKKEASQTPPSLLRHNPASPPKYRKEEAEERLDSGFSEPSTSSGCSTSRSCSTTKKVRFCDDVEEFFASCGEEEEEEDRRGPWEELARDRCRFMRRCQEVEQSINFCLQPEHRHLVYRRLSPSSTPRTPEDHPSVLYA